VVGECGQVRRRVEGLFLPGIVKSFYFVQKISDRVKVVRMEVSAHTWHIWHKSETFDSCSVLICLCRLADPFARSNFAFGAGSEICKGCFQRIFTFYPIEIQN